jgi:hydrogenase large subunit
MKQRITIDPFTRIEGHFKVDTTVDGGKVVDARVSGTMARGFESLLIGRDPRDATVITERICGVCSAVHGWTSSMAVEMAQGTTTLPDAARIIRNLIVSACWLHDHVLHFYLLTLPDYLDISSLASYKGKESTILKLRDLVMTELTDSEMKGRFAGFLYPSYAPDKYCVTDPFI